MCYKINKIINKGEDNMNYLSDLYNAVQLYNTTHKEKANEVILGISCYRFIKNRIRHMSEWQPVFDDKGILREVLGLQIKIDYFCPNLIEVRRNVYLNDPLGYIWLNKEEMKKEVDDELSALMDNDLKYLHSWIKFEEYYNNRKDKEE